MLLRGWMSLQESADSGKNRESSALLGVEQLNLCCINQNDDLNDISVKT